MRADSAALGTCDYDLSHAARESARTASFTPRLPLGVALCAIVLSLPALGIGWQADDYFLRAAILHPPELNGLLPGPLDPYSFAGGDPARTERMVAAGLLPWWTLPSLRLAFFRPLTALTFWLDYAFWPQSPALMHAQSLLWLGLMVWAAAWAYREALGRTWIAGLAAVLFAVDDAHGFPVGWLAARNGITAASLAFVAVAIHMRAARTNRLRTDMLGSVALLAGLLAGEMAVGAAAYLCAHAFCMDERKWSRRVVALSPYVVIVVAWRIAYVAWGYGAAGSPWYLNPTADPVAFASAALVRGPILLIGQLGFATADAFLLLDVATKRLVLAGIVALLFAIAILLGPLAWRDRRARFWLVGMLLAVVPACAGIPSDRMTLVTGLGAMGLLAQLVAIVAPRTRVLGALFPSAGAASKMRQSLVAALRSFTVVVLLAINLVVAPALLPIRTWSAGFLGTIESRGSAGLEDVDADRTAVILNAPCALLVNWRSPLLRDWQRAAKQRVYVLAADAAPVTVRVLDAHTLEVRPQEGYLLPPGTRDYAPTGLDRWLDLTFMLQHLDEVVRDDRSPFAVGTVTHLDGSTSRSAS